MESLVIDQNQGYNQYGTLLKILQGKNAIVKDTLRENNGGVSPITYGDFYLDDEGKQNPKETILTCPIDYFSKQCLDYAILYIPKNSNNHQETKKLQQDMGNITINIDKNYKEEQDNISIKKSPKEDVS